MENAHGQAENGIPIVFSFSGTHCIKVLENSESMFSCIMWSTIYNTIHLLGEKYLNEISSKKH